MRAGDTMLVRLPHAYNPDRGTRVQLAWQRHCSTSWFHRCAPGSFRYGAALRAPAPAAASR